MQENLFDLPPPELAPVTPSDALVELAARLPRALRLGGMSWSYRGWVGHVYGTGASDKRLALHGLTAYGKHPLLRMVELDRSYYDPLSASTVRAFADQVPDDFLFWAKAHEDTVVARFPEHARYGMRRGANNPRFLDPSYARDVVIAPLVEGFGSKLGGILFQFPPQDTSEPARFAARLEAFLAGLPRTAQYAVELRNPELLTPAYAEALARHGAIHCHNVWTAMPSAHAQARRIPPAARRPLLLRWLLRTGHRYEDASATYAPFDHIVEEDLVNRSLLAKLAARALQHDVPVQILVDNKAEGCAPESIIRLAREIAYNLQQE
ncbi:MAG TPA: DUF72 domain-containing protein [Polyangiales bacterium]